MTDHDEQPSPRGWAAADLGRLLPTGSAQTPTTAVPTQYDATGGDLQRVVGGPAVVTPLPRPKPVPRREPTSGLRLSVVGRSVVGGALVVAVGFMLYTAWRNIIG